MAELAGYLSVTVAQLEREEADWLDSLSALPRFPIPALLIARLAVDACAQGQGVGRVLLRHALGLALTLVEQGPLPVRVVMAHAIDEEAVAFYTHHGFTRPGETPPWLVVLDLDALLSPGE